MTSAAGRLLDLDEAAEILHLSRVKVQRYCAAGRFPHLKFGQEIRFTEAHLSEIQAAAEVARKDADPAEPDGVAVWGNRSRGKRAS